jgi:thioredoxin 1
MPVISEIEDNLTKLIYAEKYIAIKYFTSDCDICKALAPAFERFSNDAKFNNVIFVKIKADDNSIARQYITNYKASIMVSYKDGLLINSSTVASEKAMRSFLEELIENKS